MDLEYVINHRKTTNGPFAPRPVTLEHQHRIVEAAARAPSHFNSQPWRFVLISDEQIKRSIAEIAGTTMTDLIAEGTFFSRYKRYFRFDNNELLKRGDGILIDQLPGPLRPFVKQVFTNTGLKVINTLGVPKTLGEDNRKLVESSPLILGAMLTKEEYIEGQLSGFYSVLGLGMAIENIWLTCTDLGMGIQFISTPMEFPQAWAKIKKIIEVPEDLELIALYRIGYNQDQGKRPRIDWKSSHRKRISQYVFRDRCTTPEQDTKSHHSSEPSPVSSL